MKNLRKLSRYIGLVLGILIFTYQIKSGFSALQQKDLSITFSPQLLLAFLAVISAMAFQMLAWSSAMKSLQVHLPFVQVMKGYVLSFLPRYIPGTIWGYISRTEWLYQKYGIDEHVTYQGSIVETLASIVADLIVVAIFTSYTSTLVRIQVLLDSILLPVLLWYLFKRLACVPWPKVRFLNSAIHLLCPKMDLAHWLKSVFYFIVMWGLNGLGLMMISHLYGGAVGNMGGWVTSWGAFTSIYAIAWLIGFVVLFAPAGLGFRELALTGLISSQMHISFGLASILAILFRMVTLLSELIWLGIGLLLRRSLPLKATKDVPPGAD